MLELKNVKKLYNSELIFEIPHLQIDSGINIISGKNGYGKTTFLKIIAGLLPFEGDIFFNNINLKTQPASYRKQISLAEAEPLYPSFLRGAELVALYQTIRNVTQKDIDDLIYLFSMHEYIDFNYS